jgi:hypothetical protein
MISVLTICVRQNWVDILLLIYVLKEPKVTTIDIAELEKLTDNDYGRKYI